MFSPPLPSFRENLNFVQKIIHLSWLLDTTKQLFVGLLTRRVQWSSDGFDGAERVGRPPCSLPTHSASLFKRGSVVGMGLCVRMSDPLFTQLGSGSSTPGRAEFGAGIGLDLLPLSRSFCRPEAVLLVALVFLLVLLLVLRL